MPTNRNALWTALSVTIASQSMRRRLFNILSALSVAMKRLPWILASANAVVNLTFLGWAWCHDEQGQGDVLVPLILALINLPASLLAFPLAGVVGILGLLAHVSMHDHPYVFYFLTFVPIGFAQYYLVGVAIRKSANWWLCRRRRLTSGLCPKCGHDLRSSKDRCPE